MSSLKYKKVKNQAHQKKIALNFARTLSIGLGGCIAMNGSYYNKRLYRIIATSDTKALRSDWRVIGNDISQAIERVKSEIPV